MPDEARNIYCSRKSDAPRSDDALLQASRCRGYSFRSRLISYGGVMPLSPASSWWRSLPAFPILHERYDSSVLVIRQGESDLSEHRYSIFRIAGVVVSWNALRHSRSASRLQSPRFRTPWGHRDLQQDVEIQTSNGSRYMIDICRDRYIVLARRR